MTNTHINVGGHKITTNKVGTIHNATINTTDYPGAYVQFVVINGFCQVYMQGVNTKNDNIRRVVATGLPKAKLTGSLAIGDTFYVFTSSTQLEVNNSAIVSVWASLTYPVADDWVEN